VEVIYDLPNGFTTYNETDDTWETDSIYYSFSETSSLDIEADPGTTIYIGKAKDGSDKIEVTIGATGKYSFKPAENAILYIAFKEPQFAIINYNCVTN
jgi:hypothetical protein